MNSYEKRSILTFISIYMGGTILLFSLIGFWYYTKENRRIIQEEKIALKLYNSKCKRLEHFAPKTFTCKLEKQDESLQYKRLHIELSVAFFIMLLFSATLSYILAKISLRPMHEANKLMDEFIHSMIHDLNTPITAAKLSSESLKNSSLTSSQLKKIQRIDKSLYQLINLQQQLRSSIKNVSHNFENSRFELCEILEDFTTYSELISLTCKNKLTINADIMMIQRMIENIVTNAIKYNKESNKIEILLEDTKLYIIDKGQGIKDINLVLEQYYRESSSMSGLGLGLSIVKMVSDNYKLNLEVKSTLHVGTTVSLDFLSITTH